ncbi:hypothetical protein WR25_23655 [Diploscapter pachys]|uniref:Uncharacterized protein n=1 Tax=Diploscapter pachys TaxID=2018661 RepID=A0A2A2M1V7_9BILA|nr:hypothetical protein WR25_23655 [Diploscapter pachys]
MRSVFGVPNIPPVTDSLIDVDQSTYGGNAAAARSRLVLRPGTDITTHDERDEDEREDDQKSDDDDDQPPPQNFEGV